LKVCEESHRSIYVGALCSLGSATKQQHKSGAVSTEIHSIPGPKVQPHFPNAITQKLVIAKMACSEPVNPPQHRNSGFHVLQLVQPGLKRIGSGRSQVMNNLYRHIRL
jgi:hypothetical protein